MFQAHKPDSILLAPLVKKRVVVRQSKSPFLLPPLNHPMGSSAIRDYGGCLTVPPARESSIAGLSRAVPVLLMIALPHQGHNNWTGMEEPVWEEAVLAVVLVC